VCVISPVTAGARRRFFYLVLFVAATLVVALAGIGRLPLTPESLRAAVTRWGALAPVVFVLLLILRPFIFFPSTLLFTVGGLVFGPVPGTVLAVAGATCGGIITFVLARRLGSEFVQAKLPERVKRLQREQWGVGLLFVLNLVPVVSLTAVNYAAGLSRITLAHYALATAAGLMPRVFAYAYFGDSLLDIGSRQFMLALGFLAVLRVVPTALRYLWMRRTDPEPHR